MTRFLRIIKIITLTFLVSCNTKKEFIKSDRLIEFRSRTVMNMDDLVELDEKQSEKLYSAKFSPETDTIQFDDGSIYISYLSIVNGCGQYAGNIAVKTDTIILKLVDMKGIACTEQRCDRLIFRIRNSENKRYVIEKW